jgi:hypothetical protein
VVTSTTHLTNRANDVANDNYRVGVPRVTAPDVVTAATPKPGSKLLKINDATARVFDYSQGALKITLLVLACAAAWFALGLTLRRHKNRRYEYEDVEEPPVDVGATG